MTEPFLSGAAADELRQSFRRELVGNILPFWMTRAVDDDNGGFYSALSNDLRVNNDAPRTATVYGRILWTYAAAARLLQDPQYLAPAKRAYDYIRQHFWDHDYNGVYWSIDCHGKPIDDRKHSYAQCFVIYGLAEYYRATGDAEALRQAQELYRLLELHAYDQQHQGYREGCSRSWGPLDDMRLATDEPHRRKSMNTHLHIMEAYTNLLRVWDHPGLKAKQGELIAVILRHIVDPSGQHFRAFFDDDWRVLSDPDHTSFGHDIEGSLLLDEAAQGLGDAELITLVQPTILKMAQNVYAQGRDADGAVIYESGASGKNYDRHWWAQSEAVVGFYNAYQRSHQQYFAKAALQCWEYIEHHFIDKTHGEWFKILRRDGTPDLGHFKIGPWECPYHNSRVCFEMMERLADGAPQLTVASR
jgi:mannobiose 2-epimerase